MTAMWCLFVGIGLGVLQVFLLKKTVDVMTSSKSFIGLGVMISVGKLALILVTLFLIARLIDIEHMLWCAGGIAIAMIGIPIIRGVMNIKKYKTAGDAPALDETPVKEAQNSSAAQSQENQEEQ